MMYMHGSKDKYRLERDLYAVRSHTEKAREIFSGANTSQKQKTTSSLLSYDVLIELVSQSIAKVYVYVTSSL